MGNNRSKKNKGFSLVELIVVIAVMAVLVGVLAPAYLRYVDKAELQKDVSAIGEVIEAIKVAAAEEDVAEIIPNVGEDGSKAWETTVMITENTGAITATTTKTGKNVDKLLREVQETVGDTITFSNKTIKSIGIEMNVERDENYNVTVSVEVYEYKPYDEIYEALNDAFSVFKSPTKVVSNVLQQFKTTFTPIWEEYSAMNPVEQFFGGGKLLQNLANTITGTWSANQEDLADAGVNDAIDFAYYAIDEIDGLDSDAKNFLKDAIEYIK